MDAPNKCKLQYKSEQEYNGITKSTPFSIFRHPLKNCATSHVTMLCCKLQSKCNCTFFLPYNNTNSLLCRIEHVSTFCNNIMQQKLGCLYMQHYLCNLFTAQYCCQLVARFCCSYYHTSKELSNVLSAASLICQYPLPTLLLLQKISPAPLSQ